MLSYYLKWKKKKKKSMNPKVSKTNNGKTMILSKYAICGVKNQDFIKNKKQVEY